MRIIVTLALLFGWILAAVIGERCKRMLFPLFLADEVSATLPLYLEGSFGPIYGVSSGLTCGVRDVYPRHKFLLHILPVRFIESARFYPTEIFQIFTAASLSVILFALIFLALRGFIEVKGGLKVNVHTKERDSILSDSYHQFVFGIAKSMLW